MSLCYRNVYINATTAGKKRRKEQGSVRKREERWEERVVVPVERAIRGSWKRVTKRRGILSSHYVSYKGSGFSRVARRVQHSLRMDAFKPLNSR